MTAALIGTTYGAVSGYFGGKVDGWMTRLLDLIYGIPAILVVILLMVYFRAASAAPSSMTAMAARGLRRDPAVSKCPHAIWLGVS